MKTPLYLLLIANAVMGWSQDTLKFKSGALEVVVVEEISPTDLSYRKYINPNGPLYRILKTEIEYVRYQNGDREFFLDIAVDQRAETKTGRELIIIDGIQLYQYGLPVGERILLVLAESLPKGEKKWRMHQKYKQMLDYKKMQYLFHTGGLIFTIGTSIAALTILSGPLPDPSVYLLFGTGLGAGITQLVISGTHKRNRMEKRAEMAAIYNE